MVNGFLISDNVGVIHIETLDKEFLYSDHNPVKLAFKLITD